MIKMAKMRMRSTQHVDTAKKLLIHIGDVGGDPMRCVGPAIKRVMWRRYAKESNKGYKLLKRPKRRTRSIFFVATCFTNNITSEAWLIDSGCTHHMTYDKGMFVNLEETYYSKVKIGNGDYIEVKGIGDIIINIGS